MKYKTIIFDLDGTLLNTLDDLANSVNYALKACTMPERTLDEVRRFIGNGVRMLMKRSVPEGTNDIAFEQAYNAFVSHYAENSQNCTAPYDGVCEMLEKLKNKGYKLAVVSNKIDFAVKKLCSGFFAGVVDVAIGDSEETKNKPAPDMVYKALEQLGMEPESCVYVGDTDVDLATAMNSGMDCITVSWGFRSRAELESYGSERIIDLPEDIFMLV